MKTYGELGESVQLAIEEPPEGGARPAWVPSSFFLHLTQDPASPGSQRLDAVEGHGHQNPSFGGEAEWADWRLDFGELDANHHARTEKAASSIRHTLAVLDDPRTRVQWVADAS